MTSSRILAAIVCLLPASLASAQATSGRLTFDVASIRPSQPGVTRGMIKALPGGHGYTAQNVPIKLMVSLMYKVPMRQISGGPEWFASDNYDIEARSDGSYNLDDLHTMFQNLLADRFNLKFHKDIKAGPVYVLSVDKTGLKMTPNDSPQEFNIPINFTTANDAVGKRVPMLYFRWWLGQQLQRDERPVIDQTGLTGNFDFALSFSPPRAPDAGGDTPTDHPSLFDALKQQLGLKLEAQKGPVEYYVIDHLDKPSDN